MTNKLTSMIAKKALETTDPNILAMLSTSKREIKRYNAPKWREMRRAILAQIIAEDPHKNWTSVELAQKMRAHPLVYQVQPDYNQSTAWRDWALIKKELAKIRQDFASDYIHRQLDILDEIITDLYREYRELDMIDPKDLEPSLRVKWLDDRIRAKERLWKALDRAFKRQSVLVPINIPKRMDIHKTNVNVSLDAFLEMKRAALESPDIIEGQIEEATTPQSND